MIEQPQNPFIFFFSLPRHQRKEQTNETLKEQKMNRRREKKNIDYREREEIL